MEFDESKSTIMSESGSNIQISKKKKARNKKLFNLR